MLFGRTLVAPRRVNRIGPAHPRSGRGRAVSRLKGHDQIVIAKQGGRAPHSKVLAGYLEVVDQ